MVFKLDNLYECENYTFTEYGIKFNFVRYSKIVVVSVLQTTLQENLEGNIGLSSQIPQSMRPKITIYLNSTAARTYSNIEFTFNNNGRISINRISGIYSFGTVSWIV